MNSEIQPMTAARARSLVDDIRSRLGEVRDLILEFYTSEGWVALGYPSWLDCVKNEFGHSKTWLYQELNAAIIEQQLSIESETERNGEDAQISAIADKSYSDSSKPPNTSRKSGSSNRMPEGQIRPLAQLPTAEARREAYKEASANGEPTGKKVQEVVDKKLGKTRVNGVLQDDPPDVAKQRQRGILAPDVVPEVTEPEPVEEQLPLPMDAKEGEMSEELWLATLPLNEQLRGTCLLIFQRDAMVYRAMESVRRTFQHHASRIMKSYRNRRPRSAGGGEYVYRLTSFMRLNHPKHWHLCAPTDKGGCAGEGTIGTIGECPRCRGRGYWI
jgi:hypothetical protein